MKELLKNNTPWNKVNVLKHCDVDLLFSFDLNKGVEHKLISFALNLLCVSKKYELIFITYGQHIYVYEMNKFMSTNDINKNDNKDCNFRINFNNHDIEKNNYCFKNMNKIRYLYDEIKKEFYLKKLNIPSPVLILSPHMYSKGYVNIKCEEKEKSEKSILICVGWSEDTNIYYVEKIVECINIKKKLKNLLEKNLYNDKTCENINYQAHNSPFQYLNNDTYYFLKKLKIDKNNFILNIIHDNECINNYSNEFIDLFQLSKSNNNFDYTKNKMKEKRSILLHKLEERRKKKVISIISKEKKKYWASKIILNKNVQKGIKNPFLKIKKKNLYKKNYKCILRNKKNISNYSDKKNVANKILKKKFKLSDFYSSLESEEEDEEEKNSELIEKNKKNYKKNNYNNFLDYDEKEIEEINFYRKFRNKVYIGYNLRPNSELNEKNDYINSFRQNNQLVDEYLKSSSDENKDNDSELQLSKYKKNRNILKFCEYKNFFKSLKKEKNKKGNIFDNKKAFSNIINFKNNNNLYYSQKKYQINIKKYNGDNKQMQLKRLNKNIENYMLYIKQLNFLKEERKKFVNFCKLYIKHKYYEEYSKRLETFLDPSVKIKYHKIWKQFNVFTFNLFNVDYNDKILRSVHVYLQPDIVFNNKMYIKSDTSTWAISFNFKKNLLAIGSNTHNIHIYNLNNFYYFRKRYNYDEAINYFKNTFIYKNFQVNNMFRDNRKYIFFNNDNKKNKKKRKKNNKSTNYSNIYNNTKKKRNSLLNISTITKNSETDISLNAQKKIKSYSYSNDMTKIYNANIQNRLSPNHSLPKIEKKNFEKFRMNKSYYYKEHFIYNYLSDSFYEQIKRRNYKCKKADSLILEKYDFNDKFKMYLNKSEKACKNYSKKSIKRKKVFGKSCYSADDYMVNYNKIINVNNDNKNLSSDINDQYDSKENYLNYFERGLKLKKEQKCVLHYIKKEKNSSISKKNYKNIPQVEEIATSILLKKSKIPVDLSLFFILRKENLKNILLTISYNFPNDSIILFLKQACIGDEIYHIKWRIRYNSLSTIHKMRKLYIKKFGSRKNFHLKLFDSNTLIINSENFLKNWFLKYFCKNIFLNLNLLLKNRKMKKQSKGNLSNNMISHDNNTYDNYKTILRKNKIDKIESNKNKEKKNKKNQVNNKKIKVISKDLLPENTSSDEPFNKKYIYSTQKNYNLLKIENHYVFPFSNINDYMRNDSENKIIHYTFKYSYKRANLTLKKISKIFRNFIKDRYKYIFYNKNQLYSNENFIYIVKNKKNKEYLNNYDEVSMKYIKKLKEAIKNIQSNTQGFCLNKKNNIKKIEEGLLKNKLLIICELRDHNNNLLDIIHLSNEHKDDKEDFLSDTPSDKLIEDNNIYYTLNFYKDENNNKKKYITKNSFNIPKIFSNSKITESYLSGIINNTIEMEMKNLKANNSYLLNLDRKKSINFSSNFNHESDKSSSLSSIKKIGNNIECRTNLSYTNIPVNEGSSYINTQINGNTIQNGDHVLRNENNIEISNSNNYITHSIHNFRVLQNNFINDSYSNSQNYENARDSYLNDNRDTYINNILNDSHNILNLNNRTNYMNNSLSNNADNLDNFSNIHLNDIDNLNINENLHSINSSDNNNNLNINNRNINISLNNNFESSTNRNDNTEVNINLSSITNLNLNTNLNSINNSDNNVQNFSDFLFNNEYMFLNILYNNILNMGNANRSFSNLLDSSNLSFNRNILTNVNHNNSNRCINMRINREINNDNFYNKILQNNSAISSEKMKKHNGISGIKCKSEKKVKKEVSNNFHEVPLSMKSICKKNKYDVTIKNIYTLSKSADEIFFTFKKNSEIFFDFVIVCEGLYEEKWKTNEKVEQNEVNKKKTESDESNEEKKKIEKEEERTKLKSKNYEIFQKKLRKQRKLQHVEKQKKENVQTFGNVNKLKENNMNGHLKNFSSSYKDFSFLKNENNYTDKNNYNYSNLIEGNYKNENGNIKNYNININSTNISCESNKNINSKKASPDFTSDFLESSDTSYNSSSENFSDFNYRSESCYEECSQCEYSNLCIENKSEIDYNSTYKFLKSENSLLYVDNCNVSIKKNEKSLSKYYLKRTSSHKNKYISHVNTKIITLNINDFDYQPLFCKTEIIENTKKHESNNKEILSKTGRNDALIKSEWIEKILLQEDYYEVQERKDKKQKKKNKIVEKRNRNEKYEKKKDKSKLLNIMKILKKCKLNYNLRKKKKKKRKYEKNLVYTNIIKSSNKVKNKNNISSKKVRKNYNYNISSLIHYKEKEIRNYFYDEKNINYISNHVKKKFLDKINNEYVEKVVSEIMWTFSNVIFYSADWYDILYRLFFDVSSRFYELVIKHHQHNIPCVKFSPDNNFLLSCSVDKSVVLWYPFNIENFNLKRNFNIYDHILPHNGNKKNRNTCNNSILNNLYTNVTLKINYANKKNVFEKIYQDTEMWKRKKEQELIKKINNDILCRQSLKYMGWSCDFVIKKNVSKFDFLIDLFHKEKFLNRHNFNYSSYFPFNYANLNNFLVLFEKYSLFHLFRCSFLGIKNKISLNFNNFITYLYKTNVKKAKYLEENKIKNILEILTQKNINKKYNMKKVKRLYSAMKYIAKNLLKPYILIHPLKCDKYYPNTMMKLSEESLLNCPHFLTDCDLTYSDDSENALNENLKSKSDKLSFFTENKIKNNKITSLYYDHSESEDSYKSNDELSSSDNEVKTKPKFSMNDNESDKNYLEKNKYEKSLFYKYIHKIRNEFSLNFLLYEERADISKWTFIFQKLLNQYSDMKCFKDIYKHIKNKILTKYINKYENLKPNLYFNFYITRNYNESKVLKEILLNYSTYFNGKKNRISSNKYGKINKEFKLFLKLIKNQKLLGNNYKKEKWINIKKKKKIEDVKKTKNNNNNAFENKGYTIILKNNINNLHNVINNIINISHRNKIIKHHKYFKENNIYNNNNCNKKKKKVKNNSESIKNDKINIQEGVFQNYFNDFKKYCNDFYSTDSFNSHFSDTSFKKYKRKTKKMKKKKNNKTNNLKNGCLKESNEKYFSALNNVRITFSESNKEKKKKSGNFFFNNNKALKKADLKEILMKERKKFNICFLNSKNKKYKINYFSNMNILQNMYKYCGRGLILVNVKYIENSFQNENLSKKKKDENKSYIKKLNNIIFQTDIYICKAKTTKNNTYSKIYLHKKSRDIIFILKVNVEELKNYLLRKFIFEEKYINNSFYINLKVVKIIYLLTLKNCALIDKNSNIIERKMEKTNKKILKFCLSKEEFTFFTYLTNNLFKKKNKHALTAKMIYKNIIKMRNYIFNSKNINISTVIQDYPLNDFEKLGLSKDKFQTSFNIFFSLLPQNKKNIIMLNISTLRFLYSHINKKKKKKNICCINKDREIYDAIINKDEKKQLSKYLILSADKCKLYLLKIKYKKITKNLFTTKFIPISVQTIPKEHILPSAFKTSRISLLKIIYEKSCVLLANQYSNNIFVYFIHKCVYTNSYFLIPYFILPLYTENIGKELFYCFNKDVSNNENSYFVNNINYNLKKLLVINSKETPEESNFFIAGFDVIYVERKDNNFELTIFAILLSNIIFCYKLKFHYY
ncbi:conserved Plasmodium protein, unknown function [Plasmodium relictum]|uniref:Uncharacterized protein n=1 Tax=Plasmodium relictum TaxID=85471 RepID=A0A1J1HHV5_PLARL|nr:conserved Plasmodium protein, unknown function [Plasmodium relictum]CRH04034.1 conserved Plasmodium protein, unknown function [Plasmodium relictum]